MKKNEKQIIQINQLLSISEHVPDRYRRTSTESISAAYFGMGSSNISFIGSKNYQTFSETIKDLFNSNKGISDSYSIDEFQNGIIDLLRELRREGVQCDYEKYQTLIDRLEAIELKPHEIFYPISGIFLNGSSRELGDFTIYKIPESLPFLQKTYPSLMRDDFYKRFESSRYWIGLKALVRDGKKAAELANTSFELFEHIINYMRLNVEQKSKLRIFGPIAADSITSIVCTKDDLASGETFDNSEIVDLDASIFVSAEIGNDKIWKLASASVTNEIESRILAAVQWIGKGASERDPAKSIIQFVFAIEGMFRQSDNTVFTPSILGSVSENLAFLISDDLIGRMEVIELFKDTYKYRSAIAHGGSKNISIDNQKQAHLLSCQMVISFLKKEPFSSMTSTKDFNAYIKKLKFDN